jgi:hypothetical protein
VIAEPQASLQLAASSGLHYSTMLALLDCRLTSSRAV